MSLAEGGRGNRVNSQPSTEKGSNISFDISVATFNAGNGKRGRQAVMRATQKMLDFSQIKQGPAIIGFQEIPPQEKVGKDIGSMLDIDNVLRQYPNWQLLSFPNPTQDHSDYSMAIAYDSSYLHTENVFKIPLPPLPSVHTIFDFPPRETPLQREAQAVHFTLTSDPYIHIFLVNAHLSVKGRLKQRGQEIATILDSVSEFIESENVNLDTDFVAQFLIGDLNTAGRIGSKRNLRQTEGLRLEESGFRKLNNRFVTTSNFFSNTLHFAHNIVGDKAFDLASKFYIPQTARRAKRVAERLLAYGDQHRDHIFLALSSLREQSETEDATFERSGQPPDSDHFAVAVRSTLSRVEK